MNHKSVTTKTLHYVDSLHGDVLVFCYLFTELMSIWITNMADENHAL